MNAAQIYDSLPESARDMSREAFIKRMRELTDPRRMRSDLNQILQGKRTKRTIDGAVENG